MKLLVVHDAVGRILGMGEVHPNPRHRRVGVAPRPGQFVIEVEREAAFPHFHLHEVMRRCRVDTEAKQLILREA